jgi:integrase
LGDLVNAQYLDHNASAKIKVFLESETDHAGDERRVAAKPRGQVERSLTEEAWTFAMRVLDGMPDSDTAARTRFVLAFAYSTGLRRSELCRGFTDDISVRDAGTKVGSIHLPRVVGKGDRNALQPSCRRC